VTFFKQIVSFIKNHWYIPLFAIISTLSYLLAQKDKLPVGEILKASKKTHDLEKAAIVQAEKEKKVAKKKVDEQFKKTVEKIKNEHNISDKELSRKKKKEVKKIVEKHYNKPEEIAKNISDMFGFQDVSKNNNDSD
jgi:hypothetical protein